MSLLGSLVDAGVGIYNNERNLAFQQAAIDQNMALTRESWARDDNAIQRRVADLKAAGLNPILAAGSAAGNSNPIRVEPKKSDFKTDFGSSSLAEDIGKVQQIKHNKLINQSAALQNAILDEQKKGLELDNEKKRLDISHYGESPTFKLISAAVEAATGKPIWEWVADLGRYFGWRDKPSETIPEVEEFVGNFVLSDASSDYWNIRSGKVNFTVTGKALMREAAKKLGISFDEFSSIMEEAILKRQYTRPEFKFSEDGAGVYTGQSPIGATSGGYAW